MGEQDLFCFLIDPAGWIDIESQAFAPGFFVWNSEVGRRAVGMQTFWFQWVCANHIVWDATDVVEFTRRHTSEVPEALGEIRQAIEKLIAKRDERKDSFARAVTCAMQTDLGHDADKALMALPEPRLCQALREAGNRDRRRRPAVHDLRLSRRDDAYRQRAAICRRPVSPRPKGELAFGPGPGRLDGGSLHVQPPSRPALFADLL